MPTLTSTIDCLDDAGNSWQVEQVVGDHGLTFVVVSPDGTRRRLTPVVPTRPSTRLSVDAETPLPLDLP